MDVLVLRVGVVPHLTAAVRTAEDIAEDTLRTVFLLRCALMRAFQPFLHLFIGVTLDDRLVSVLKHHPVLFRVVDTAVIFERLGVRFEVQHVAAIFLPRQYIKTEIGIPKRTNLNTANGFRTKQTAT